MERKSENTSSGKSKKEQIFHEESLKSLYELSESDSILGKRENLSDDGQENILALSSDIISLKNLIPLSIKIISHQNLEVEEFLELTENELKALFIYLIKRDIIEKNEIKLFLPATVKRIENLILKLKKSSMISKRHLIRYQDGLINSLLRDYFNDWFSTTEENIDSFTDNKTINKFFWKFLFKNNSKFKRDFPKIESRRHSDKKITKNTPFLKKPHFLALFNKKSTIKIVIDVLKNDSKFCEFYKNIKNTIEEEFKDSGKGFDFNKFEEKSEIKENHFKFNLKQEFFNFYKILQKNVCFENEILNIENSLKQTKIKSMKSPKTLADYQRLFDSLDISFNFDI